MPEEFADNEIEEEANPFSESDDDEQAGDSDDFTD